MAERQDVLADELWAGIGPRRPQGGGRPAGGGGRAAAPSAKRQGVWAGVLWAEIAPRLPRDAAPPKGGGRWVDDRRRRAGVLWVLRTGPGSQKMPKPHPPAPTGWRGMQAWAGEGVLAEVHANL